MDLNDHHSVRARAVSAVPPWVESIGMPVWITSPSGSIRYLNARAEAFFGHTLDQWSGLPCHLVVAGRTRAGPFCSPRCRVRTQAVAGGEIEPFWVEIATKDGLRTDVCVVVIAVETQAGPQLVHVLVDDERERKIRGFLTRVVSRASGDSDRAEPRELTAPPDPSELSPREHEVLSMLAADANLREIAKQLSLSHATVRNHVQHILAKLGVHSTLEAVAVWLMDDEGRG